MDSEFLTGLGIAEDVSEKILAEYGRRDEKHKGEVSTLSEQLKTAQDSLAAANDEIKRYQDMDFEGIQKSAAEYRQKYEEAKKEADARIAEMEYSAALKEALAGERFTSEYARRGVFDEIKGKNLPLENGKIMGLSDALKALKESSPDAFAPDKPPAGVLPGIVSNMPSGRNTIDEYKKMPPQEKIKFKQENPALYSQFKKALGF